MLRIEELEAALPTMTRWRAGSPRRVDWAALEGGLGTALPADYRVLAEAYPTLVIDDFLSVALPAPGFETNFVAGRRYSSEILRDLWEIDETEGYAPYPEPGGVLCWGESYSGDQLYWKMNSPDPDAWPVVVFGRNGDWSEFEMGVVEFLAATYRRTIDIPGMPANFPSEHPQVMGHDRRSAT
ncbi:SMI1/KNR4 family protein [Streptomyces sp. 21So2-11]|uniref:SMI1/KNR4 family protein n=1 Tax=Streptomyces sp. 21So2-11 TaxID=3144408 RepID=UPI0032195CFF